MTTDLIMNEPNDASRRSFTIYAANHRLYAEYIKPLANPSMKSPSTLVFLHEGFGSIGQWSNFPRALSTATGCPALVYDRWGYGNSDPLTGTRALHYMHDEALNSLPEVLAQCSINNVILVEKANLCPSILEEIGKK